jgi:hypothetical protein
MHEATMAKRRKVGKREGGFVLQRQRKIIDAASPRVLCDRRGMKQNDNPNFPFLLALGQGQVFNQVNNQSAREL